MGQAKRLFMQLSISKLVVPDKKSNSIIFAAHVSDHQEFSFYVRPGKGALFLHEQPAFFMQYFICKKNNQQAIFGQQQSTGKTVFELDF